MCRIERKIYYEKKITSIMLLATMILSMSVTVFANSGGLGNFKNVNQYTNGKFTDVADKEWYAQSVKTAYELDIVNGNSDTTFNPEGNILISETIAIASRIHSIYNTGKADFATSTPWYQSYVDYAKENKIISGAYTYFDKATRTDFAKIMSKAVAETEFNAVNMVEDNAIPDVKMIMDGSASVYLLYRAGILTGSDSNGTFNPESNITRGEVAAIISRIIKPEQRKSISLKYVVSETYKLFPAKTVTAVTGAECTLSWTGWDIQVNNGYLDGRNNYCYDGLDWDDYDKYFAPYIEYLQTNPNLVRTEGDDVISMGGFTSESYTYKITDGSEKYMMVSWNVPRYGDDYEVKVWFFTYTNGMVTDITQ